MLRTHPAVFAIGDTYQIMVPVNGDCMMYVRVGDKVYYDEDNGIIRSAALVHKAIVPMAELDAAGEYTVGTIEVTDRKPYGTDTGKTEEKVYKFRPVPKGDVRCYEIADAHANVDSFVECVKKYGDIDFLILNGDINNHSDEPESFITAYEIASGVTGGEIPVVSVRGNHDMRGRAAADCAKYIPTDAGKTYYTFRLGNIWGMALDCGEDKDDSNGEYGGTICCHAFRERQTEFIRDVIARKAEEYEAEGVEHRVIICHIPFTMEENGVFDIEREIYNEWSRLIRDEIGADVMICGHVHLQFILEPGKDEKRAPHPCPVVVGSARNNFYEGGTAFEFSSDKINVNFTGADGDSRGEYVIEK